MAKPTVIRGLHPDTPLDVAVPRIMRARLKDVRKWERQVAAAAEGEPVHAMRVATRRLRAALDVFGPRESGGAVKRLQDALGGVRDVEIQTAGLPPEAAALRKQLRDELPARREDLARELEEWRKRTVPELDEYAKNAGGEGSLRSGRTRRRLRKRLDRVHDLVDDLGKKLGAKRAHRLRIAVKKLRYESELLEAAFPGPVGRLQRDLGDLQDALGELHDLDVRLALLDGDPIDPALAEVRHALHAERDVQRKKLRQALRPWHRLPRKIAARLRG